MTINIDEIIKEIIKKEGGYVHHPYDKGGPTKYGITYKTAKSFFGPSYTVSSLYNLTKEQAALIYEKEYYINPGFSSLPEGIQASVMDAAVMSGPRRAIRILQETINTFNINELVVDGLLGPLTYREARTINIMWGPWFINAYADTRILYYLDIVLKDETQLVFLKGWINRALSFKPYR